MLRVVLLSLFAVSACRGKQEGRAVSESATSYCKDIASELRQASELYAAYAASGQLSPEQQQRAAIDLTYGLSPKERSVAGIHLNKDLLFCTMIRGGDSAARDALSGRVSVAAGKLSSSDAPADISKRVSELAAVAAEITALPIRD